MIPEQTYRCKQFRVVNATWNATSQYRGLTGRVVRVLPALDNPARDAVWLRFEDGRECVFRRSELEEVGD